MTINQTVDRRRQAVGLSISKLAAESDIDRANLSRFLAGHTGITTDSLDRLLAVLGLDVLPVKNVKR
jgi:transcriptional regulator with XRE-family HTH domain